VEVFLIAASSALVGFVHSLSPAHWAPVVIMTKTRKWSYGYAVVGALAAVLGHVLVSIVTAAVVIWVGATFIHNYEHLIEHYASLALVFFGITFAGIAYWNHYRCKGHTHHGPSPQKSESRPFLFLFLMGFVPCLAVIPVLLSAAPYGLSALALVSLAFCLGVSAALVGAVLLVTAGTKWLDHPVLEHYGDVISGVSVAILGVLLFFLSNGHQH
jgi:cytochrome c biogenesis protein CcdA